MSLNKYISMYTGYMRLYMFNNLSLLKLTGRCAFVFKMNYISRYSLFSGVFPTQISDVFSCNIVSFF